MKNMEELAFELDRVGAAQKCEQLMTTYVSCIWRCAIRIT